MENLTIILVCVTAVISAFVVFSVGFKLGVYQTIKHLERQIKDGNLRVTAVGVFKA